MRRSAFLLVASLSVLPLLGSAPSGVHDLPRFGEDGFLSESARRGESGRLRVVVVQPGERIGGAAAREGYRWEPVHGTGGETRPRSARAPSEPGVWKVEGPQGEEVVVITRVPFSAKRGGEVNGYQVGIYPGERGGRRPYPLPHGFIEVTPENQDLQVSEHFRLRDFLTKGQANVWPKYLVLDLRLVDKLELVMQELNRVGVRAEHMHVMSGYRHPAYNAGGNGRATLSRHMYGDAADVWIDNDRSGYTDDLDGDGRTTIDDVRVVLRAVDRVEREHPHLVGGAGTYAANSVRGPFIHIDTRGSRARW